MKRFMVIYHAPAEAMAEMANVTPEQKEAGMKPWFEWKDRVGDHLIDFGAPLMGGTRLLPDGSTEMSNKEVSGYSILQAESIEQAKSLLSGHPHLACTGGCDIEVHECIQM